MDLTSLWSVSETSPLVSVFAAVVAGLFGIAIGSFLNVVVWRVPRGESVVHPASHCPACDHPIRSRDNVPVLSWLILRGRCRDCGEPISPRYPAVELGTGVAFVGVAVWAVNSPWFTVDTPLALTSSLLAIAAYLYLTAVSIALAIIDLETFRLPNVIVLPSLAVVTVLLGAAALLRSDLGQLVTALVGSVILLAFYFLLRLVSRGGMGLGDVKLAPTLGMALGWLGLGNLVVGAFAPFVLGGLFSVILLVRRSAGMKTRIPFGPWMILGAWLGIVVGGLVFDAYLRAVGLTA